MCKVNQATCAVILYWRHFRQLALTISIAGLLAVNVGAFSSTALAGQDGDLRASLSELLFKAVTSNDINAVRTVVEAGADLARTNLHGKTAMDIAVDRGHFEIAQYLVFARRIEQRTAINAAPPVAAVRQSSPEAVPELEVVNNSTAEIPVKPVVAAKAIPPQPHSSAKPARTSLPAPTGPSYDELMAAAQKLANAAEALANKSVPEPVVTTRVAKKETEPSSPKETSLAKANQAPVYIIGPSGRLVPATAAQIQRAQRTIQNQPQLQSASRGPDIEPRKSIFIPKPRHKPTAKPRLVTREAQTQQIATVAPAPTASALPTSRIPKTSTPRIEVPAFAKPSIPRVSDGTAPQTVTIRPTRRISPQLLEKLRRRLKTTNKRKQSVSQLEDAPKILPPSLPTTVSVEPLAPVDQRAPQAADLTPAKTQPVSSKSAPATPTKETSAVQKLFDSLGSSFGSLLGLRKTDAPKPAGASPIDKSEPKITASAVQPKAVTPSARQIVPELKTLPQNSPTGFETRAVPKVPTLPAKPKAPPVEVAVIAPAPTAISSPRIEVPTAVQASRQQAKIPAPKTKAPSVLNSIKEVLLPGATVQPKVDQSISETATNKARDTTIRRVSRQMPLNRMRKPLKNVLLTLGDSVATGQTKLPRGIAEPDACVRKRRGAIAFCVVPVDWPRIIEPAFAVNTSLYQGTRAIARYDNGKATHFHALYDTTDHARILSFLKKRFGPPTDIWKRMIAPFGKPRQPNPTYVWRSLDSETDKVTILELRKFDDSRAVFPDTKHGAIRLYPAGGPPVFPIVTAHDIMSIDWAARSDHIDGASPALARTIRVQP